jgi:hypothetical protein
MQTTRVLCLGLRGRCALALATTTRPSARASLLAAAEADARLLRREGQACSLPQADLLRAGASALRGDAESARRRLESAVAGFDGAGMKVYASAARRCLGGILGGAEGADLVARENAWQQSQSIRNPDRFTALFAPGFDGGPP